MCPGLDKSTSDTNTCYCDDNGGMNLLLPIMEVVLVYDGVEYRFNGLVGSDNERSYLANSLLDVNCEANKLPSQVLHNDFRPGQAVKIGNAPV